MMTVLDQARDVVGTELYRVSSLYGAPDFVKAASRSDLAGEGDQPTHRFAHPAGRLYPIHTPAATWASAALFEEKKGAFREADRRAISDRLEKAAAYWGIAGSLEQLRSKVASVAKDDLSALDDRDFGFVMSFDNGAVERYCPLRNPSEVKAAAAWLRSYRDEFVFEDRRTIARKVIAKQAALEVELPAEDQTFLDKAAGFGTCSTADARKMVSDRASLVSRKDSKLASELRDLAGMIGAPGTDVRRPEMLQKLAAAVEKVDRMSGLAKLYGDGLPRPEDVLFAVTEKVASAFLGEHVQLTSGSLYKLADLGRLRHAQVEEHLGTEFADALSSDGVHVDEEKVAELAPTLPRGEACLFDRMASTLGIAAVEKQASLRTSGLSRKDLFALAARS